MYYVYCYLSTTSLTTCLPSSLLLTLVQVHIAVPQANIEHDSSEELNESEVEALDELDVSFLARMNPKQITKKERYVYVKYSVY